jgi:hypothetical protein
MPMATNPTEGPRASLVDRAKNIIMRPREEWPRIDAEPATIGGIYAGYVAILAAIPPLAGAIGMLLFGVRFFGIVYRPSPAHVITQAVVQYLLGLAAVYVMALIIEALAPTFGGTKDRLKAFKVAAYGATAGWLAGIFAIIPALGILAIIGGIYTLYLYYAGLPVLMKVPQDKAVIYVVAIIVAAIVLFLIVGVITTALVGAFAPMATTGTGTLSIP